MYTYTFNFKRNNDTIYREGHWYIETLIYREGHCIDIVMHKNNFVGGKKEFQEVTEQYNYPLIFASFSVILDHYALVRTYWQICVAINNIFLPDDCKY